MNTINKAERPRKEKPMKTIISTPNDFFRSLSDYDAKDLGERIVAALRDHCDMSPEAALEYAVAGLICQLGEDGEEIAEFACQTAKQVLRGDYEDMAVIKDEIQSLREDFASETDGDKGEA